MYMLRQQHCNTYWKLAEDFLHGMQGYGGVDTALGGGQSGGDAYVPGDQASGRSQDAAFGGDQTSLDAGADTNYGVIPLLPRRTQARQS